MSANKLTSVSDNALIDHLHDLVRREREVLIDVLHHLNEVERRKLHLKRGHRSLFAYCTDALQYSESAAGRRVQVARVIRRFPSVVSLLERGEVNLSTVSKVAGIAFSQGNPRIFERIRGMTQEEAAVVASEYRPRERPRDRVRPVRVRKETAETPVVMPLAGVTKAEKAVPQAAAGAGSASAIDTRHSRSGSGRGRSEPDPPVSVEQAYMVQFVAGPEFVRALEQVRALLSFRLPADAPIEDVLAIVTEEFIERHSPDRRRARRRKRTKERVGDERDEWVDAGANGERDERGERDAGNPRYIPAAVRDEAFVRASGCCTYVAPDGTRCRATRHLQVDHINPVALGGRGSDDNVRVLCAAHNRLEAERILGVETMRRHTRRE